MQLHSPETGFYFPKWIEEKLFSGFIEKVIQQIHRFFFDSKSSLTQLERQDFIEILYYFITFKVVEITSADSFSFTCKDGIDLSSSAMSGFYAFMKMMMNENLSEKDLNQIQMALFAFPMYLRQRCIKVEQFNRMVNAQKRLEKGLEKHSKSKQGKAIESYFQSLFETSFKSLSFDAMSFKKFSKS